MSMLKLLTMMMDWLIGPHWRSRPVAGHLVNFYRPSAGRPVGRLVTFYRPAAGMAPGYWKML